MPLTGQPSTARVAQAAVLCWHCPWGSTPQLLSPGLGVSSAACLGISAPVQVPAEHPEIPLTGASPRESRALLVKEFLDSCLGGVWWMVFWY